ncbi:golgin subfamily A member 6-like protein 9 [Clinocottus analis]|uniref:golgin subfamily A member 6-like protein 9 n=1 Tax=Clinocottus analis TaxID=304258 RepID=UPI0035C0A4C3
MVEIDCSRAQTLANLIQLDLSENLISFTNLQNILHCPPLQFNYLKSLHLRRSNLTSLQSLCTRLSLTPVLTVLDVSRNNFSTVHYPQCLQLKPLRMLNLSHSGITEIHLLNSSSLEELDLSYNSLEVFNNPPLTLKKLNLSHNHLISHPSLGHLSQLLDLNLDSNQFSILMNETGAVPNSTDSGSLVDFSEGLLCASPVDQQGTLIMNLSLGTCVKPTSGTQRNDSPLCLTLFEEKSFSFDKVVTVDNIQIFHPEFLQPLTESISGGVNGSLLICGALTEKISALIDQTIIKQVLADLFRHILSRGEEELFISVSFIQFYPDDNALDLLSPSRQSLKIVDHPVLGNLVGGLCEVCVCSAEEAYTLYETCRKTLKADGGSISSRCSFLFSVAVEWKLYPEEVESEVCRSRLQLFSLAGGASRTDLRGVSPLVKVMDQTQREATTDKILPFLLNDALTGNSRTTLIYCVNPQGLLDDETPSALDLAQKARGLVTKATVYRWCPRASEQKIRDSIVDQRNLMMSQGGSDVHSTFRLAELTQNLQIVKNQSWEKRRDESKKIKGKIQSCLTPNGNLLICDHRDGTDPMTHLQAQLKQEMEEHIREGKGDVEKVQERVGRIQQLRDALREETLKSGAATEHTDLCQQSQLEYSKAQEQRRRLKEDHWRLIQEEVEKMERDLAQEQLLTEGPQRELLVLTGERRVLVLQIEALRAEAQQAERDLQNQYQHHQTELHCLREESLQVFRVFRQVSEDQRRMSESRYRSVLLEAVQDAVYLSAQNQELQADNKQLRKALGELKDTLTVRGDPMAELLSQQH